jgi:transposase
MSMLLDPVAAEPDLTLDAIRLRLSGAKKLEVGTNSIWRFCDRQEITFKKTLHAVEQPYLKAPRLVFIDETAVTTKMVRHYGGSPRGERLVASVPHGHWKTLTFIAALRFNGMTAPYVVDGAMDGSTFIAYVEQVLTPTLKEGDIVYMDNLRTHKVDGVRRAIEAVGASVRYLPAYAPDLNPIEQAFSKLKTGYAQGRGPDR